MALRFSGFGGAESVIRELTKRIAKKCELVLVTDNKYLRNDENYDFKIYRFKFYDMPYLNNIEPLLFWSKKVRDLITKLKPDIIHMHGCILPLSDLTSIMTIHGTYLGEISYLSTYPVSKLYKVFYSSLIYSQFIYELKTYKFAKYYHAVSSVTKKELIRLGLDANNIQVIPNGVDCKVFKPANSRKDILPKLGIPEDSKLILYTGNIVPRKGLHLLVKSAPVILNYYDNVYFLIVGDCPKLAKSYLSHMITYLSKKGIKDYFKFLGKVSLDYLIRLYNACDLYVLPSYSEGFPLSVIEAAACGKVSVVSRNCGAIDLLGEDGYYFKTGNSSDLAQQILNALNNSKFRNWRLINRVRKKFNWDIIAGDMIKFYEWCIEYG